MSAIPHTANLSTVKADPQMNKSWFRSRYDSLCSSITASVGMQAPTTQKMAAAFAVVAACGLFVGIAYYTKKYISDLNQLNISLKDELSKARQEITNLESQNRRLAGNFNVIESQLKISEGARQKISEDFKLCSQDLDKLHPLGQSIQKCINIQSQNRKLDQAGLIVELSLARSAWDQCSLKQDKIQILEVSLKAVANENSRLTDQLMDERGQCDSDKKHLQAQIDEKQGSYNSLKAECEAFQEQHMQLEKSFNQTKIDMRKLQKSNEACETTISELQTNILRDVKQSRDQLPKDNSYWTYFFG